MKALTRRIQEHSSILLLLFGPIVLSFVLACSSADPDRDDRMYVFPHRARQGELVYMVVGGTGMVYNADSAFEEGFDWNHRSWGVFFDGIPRPIYSLSRANVTIGFYPESDPENPADVVFPEAVFPLVADPTSPLAEAGLYRNGLTVEVAAFVVPSDLQAGSYVVRPTNNPHATGKLEILPLEGDPEELNEPVLPNLSLLERRPVFRLLLQRGGDVAGTEPIDPSWEIGAISLTLMSWPYPAPFEAAYTVNKAVARGDAAGALALFEETVVGYSTNTRLHIIAPDGIRFTEPLDEGVETLGTGPFLDVVVDVHPDVTDLGMIGTWVSELSMWDIDGNLLRSGSASLPWGKPDFVRVLVVHNPES